MLIQTDEIKNQQIDLRRQAHFWKAQHRRTAQRERTFKEEISQLKKSLQAQYSVCPEKANFEILNFYKATTCFMKTCYGFSLFSEIELSTGCYG